jgi:hypothetical protein
MFKQIESDLTAGRHSAVAFRRLRGLKEATRLAFAHGLSHSSASVACDARASVADLFH